MEDYLKGLNESQFEAVTTLQGPLMVLAGAGSGKTRAYHAYRTSHYKRRRSFNILALTFTNKAAKEMKERIAKVVGRAMQEVSGWELSLGFARILRNEAHYLGYPSNFTIYDQQDALNVIKSIERYEY